MRSSQSQNVIVYLAMCFVSHTSVYATRTTALSNKYADCSSVGGIPRYAGDGDCDSYNNNEACGYDGGDCCFCTCENIEQKKCGDSGYYCLDPDASDDCRNVTTGDYPECNNVGGKPALIGDGDCDPANSNEECMYDGGDCCWCTCSDSVEYTCGDSEYFCRDPEVSDACRAESIEFSALDFSFSFSYYY